MQCCSQYAIESLPYDREKQRILMFNVASEKAHQNLSHYNQFLKDLKLIKKLIFFLVKKLEIQVINCIYDYAHLYS